MADHSRQQDLSSRIVNQRDLALQIFLCSRIFCFCDFPFTNLLYCTHIHWTNYNSVLHRRKLQHTMTLSKGINTVDTQKCDLERKIWEIKELDCENYSIKAHIRLLKSLLDPERWQIIMRTEHPESLVGRVRKAEKDKKKERSSKEKSKKTEKTLGGKNPEKRKGNRGQGDRQERRKKKGKQRIGGYTGEEEKERTESK